MGNLRDSLSRPASEQRHPVLMNAIYLWACFISRPEPLCQHEEHYLRNSLDALHEALQLGDKVIDVIQASCLLSMYFLANGRLLEGSYHASAAAALAVQSGLHKRARLHANPWASYDMADSHDRKPTKNDLQDGEEIHAFWQVYNLDRCWSVVLRKPFLIPDEMDTWNSICCPWPQEIASYETVSHIGLFSPPKLTWLQQGFVDSCSSFQAIKSFLNGDVSPDGFSVPALRAKGSTLLARADLLSQGGKAAGRLTAEQHALDHSITMFLSTLIPVNQLDAILPQDKHSLIITHTLAHTAMIHLHRSMARDDPISFDKCLQSARAGLALIKLISDQDFAFLDPIIGVSSAHLSTDLYLISNVFFCSLAGGLLARF